MLSFRECCVNVGSLSWAPPTEAKTSVSWEERPRAAVICLSTALHSSSEPSGHGSKQTVVAYSWNWENFSCHFLLCIFTFIISCDLETCPVTVRVEIGGWGHMKELFLGVSFLLSLSSLPHRLASWYLCSLRLDSDHHFDTSVSSVQNWTCAAVENSLAIPGKVKHTVTITQQFHP